MGVNARIHRCAEEKQGPVTLTERRKSTALGNADKEQTRSCGALKPLTLFEFLHIEKRNLGF